MSGETCARADRTMTRVFFLTARVCKVMMLCLVVGRTDLLYADTGILQRLAVPPLTVLTPDVDVYPRNHAIAQGQNGYLYVGNSQGLLIYDGENWQRIPMPNGKLVRSLAIGSEQRIYVGGYDGFGYVEPDTTGRMIYHSLADNFQQLREPGFADIWDLLVTDDAVYFKAVNDLFRYDPATGETQLWQHDGRFGALIADSGEVYVQFRGQGLMRYQQGQFVPAQMEALWHEQVYDLIRLSEGHWLGNARDGNWLEMRNGKVDVIDIPGLPPANAFFDLSLIAPGVIAMANKDGAVYVLEWHSGKVKRFEVSSDVLLSVVGAQNGGILALNDLQVLHLSWPSQWQSIDAKQGLRGAIYDIEFWDQQWLALGSAGAFSLSSGKENAGFSRLNWTNHEAWDLLPLTPSKALFADSYSLHIASNQSVRSISHDALYPRKLQPSRFFDRRVLIGTELGMAVWVDAPAAADGYFSIDWDELGTLVQSMVESAPGQVWLGTQHRGVVRLQLDEDYRHIVDIHYLNAADGIEYGMDNEANLAWIDDNLIASTAKGLFIFNGVDFEPWQSGLAAVAEPGQVLTLTQSKDGQIWAYSHNRLYRQSGKHWQQVELSGVGRGALTSHWLQGKFRVFGANSTLMLNQPDAAQITGAGFEVQLNRVSINDGKVSELLPLGGETLPTMSARARISFGYALPGLHAPETALYRERLLGYETEFGEWSRATQVTYSKLAPGTYRFELEARDKVGNISSIKPFDIVIPSPWYQTLPARLCWVLVGMTFLWLLIRSLVRYRTQNLAQDKERLKLMVAEHTRELANANRKLESMANVDGLTGIANRRRLDSYLSFSAQNCQERGRPLSVLLIDVDHFKRFNDTHGHIKGDAVLKDIAMLLGQSLRRSEDLLARYGGEEFTAILPGADAEAALCVARDMRDQVQNSNTGVTVSIGLACITAGQVIDTQRLIEQADKALYRAKNEGRNRVVQSAL